MYSDLHIPCSRPPRVGPSVNDDNAAGGSSSRAARPAITTLPRTAASVSGTSRLIARSNALRAKRNTEMWYSSDAAVRPSGKAHEGPMQTRLVSSLSPTTPGLLLSETEEVVEQLPHEGTQEVLGGRHGEAAYGARGRPIPVSRNRLENKSLRSRGAAPDRAIYDTHPEHDRRERETRERLRVQAELEPEKRARTAEYVQALLESRLRDEAAAHEHARSTRPTGELKVREGAEAAARERDRAQEEGHPWLEEQSGPDTDKTIKHGILGSIVTFGAGLDVCGLTTGLESCIVRVRGLPEDALEREIYALFTQQGIDIGRLCLLRNRVDHDGTRDVKMAMDAESGHAISIGLDKLEFRDRFTGGIGADSREENELESPGNVQVSLSISRTVKGKENTSFRRDQ